MLTSARAQKVASSFRPHLLLIVSALAIFVVVMRSTMHTMAWLCLILCINNCLSLKWPARLTIGPLSLMARKAVTYTSINVPVCNNQNLIIRDTESDIVEAVKMWTGSVGDLNNQVEDWSKQGKAFWDSSQGLTQLQQAEQASRIIEEVRRSEAQASSSGAVETYINCATDSEPVYMETRMYYRFRRDGSIPQSLPLPADVVTQLVDAGHATSNVTHMLLRERVLHRADDIAMRLKHDYPISSPEWNRWSNISASYNASTLGHAISTYFSEHSIGDVGDEDSQYVPRAGYVGTLAPGEKFEQEHALEDLPKKVLHPWPAMQQHAFHVRWPVTHPMTPPPLLWFALNNMYTESFTASELQRTRSEAPGAAEDFTGRIEPIIAGSMMEPRDAIRIARGATFGPSFEVSEQIPHGGSVFDYGDKIPFYNPDHGPTVSPEEAELEMPDELKPLTQRWMDPLHGLDEVTQVEQLEDAELLDAQREEEARQRAVEQMLRGQPTPSYETARKAERAALDAEVERRLMVHKEQLAKARQEAADAERRARDASLAEAISHDPSLAKRVAPAKSPTAVAANAAAGELTLSINMNLRHSALEVTPPEIVEVDDATLRERFRRELETSRMISEGELGRGRTRTRRAIIKYTVETSAELINQARAAARRAPRRPGRRRTQPAAVADTGIGEGEEDSSGTDSDVVAGGLVAGEVGDVGLDGEVEVEGDVEGGSVDAVVDDPEVGLGGSGLPSSLRRLEDDETALF